MRGSLFLFLNQWQQECVVTTDQWHLDVIKNEKNGIIIETITPDEIANAIFRLSSDRHFLAKICAENQRVSNEQYMEEHYVQKMLVIFNDYSK